MGTMTRWRRTTPSTRTLRRDIGDILEEFAPPRGLRREVDRVLAEDLAPRAAWRELDRLLDAFVSPAPLRRRLARRMADETAARGTVRARLTRLFDRVAEMTGISRRGKEMVAPDEELLTERKDAYVVRVALPGVRERDVEIRVEGDMLVISGERREEETKRERGYEYIERSHGSFTRAIELPRGVDPSRIEADVDDGVLEVRIPKGEPTRERQIPIRRQPDSRAIGGRDDGGVRGRELGQGGWREEPRVIPLERGGTSANASS
jgi:HSP20 family protein